MITPFVAFMTYLALLYLVVALVGGPLQPDQLTDDLSDVDMSQHQRTLREAAWLDSPQVNLKLSRRWNR